MSNQVDRAFGSSDKKESFDDLEKLLATVQEKRENLREWLQQLESAQ